jgi:hypothetical protein
MGKLADNLKKARPSKKEIKNKIKEENENKLNEKMKTELQQFYKKPVDYKCVNCLKNTYDYVILGKTDVGYISEEELYEIVRFTKKPEKDLHPKPRVI